MPDILVAAADLDRFERATGMTSGSITREDHQVVAALQRVGATARVAHWDDPTVAWHDTDAVLVRSAWDYTARRDEFVAWAGRVGAGTRLFPDADVVRWNTHKSYLLELEDRGAPIVPTAWLGAGDEVSLADLARDRGWAQVVAKPAVDLAGLHLLVAEDPAGAQDDFAALVADHDVLVQPLLRRIRSDGEVSVVCIDGRVSHALHKHPAPDSWRVHAEYGGRFEVIDLDRSRATLAEWVVAATGVEPLVARVDLVPADDGAWQVNEVELVEPALYLGWVPGGRRPPGRGFTGPTGRRRLDTARVTWPAPPAPSHPGSGSIGAWPCRCTSYSRPASDTTTVVSSRAVVREHRPRGARP